MKMKNVLLFEAIFQIQVSHLYNRDLQKLVHATVLEYSAQLTDDKSNDKSEQ